MESVLRGIPDGGKTEISAQGKTPAQMHYETARRLRPVDTPYAPGFPEEDNLQSTSELQSMMRKHISDVTKVC